jgi:hypothetical protein
MLFEQKRSKRDLTCRQPKIRIGVEELSHRIMLSGDIGVDPPTPPPPAIAETCGTIFE